MAAPEIRLSVGLDLEFFRGQMRKAVNIAQSEFSAQLAVRIDRNKLNTELNDLQKAIKRRVYRIEIGGNLETAPSKIASLKQALSDLEGTKAKISVGGIASINQKEARKIRTALRTSIMGEGGKILVPTSIVAAITEKDVAAFKKAVAEKLSGIKVNVDVQGGGFSGTSAGTAGLHEYMRTQGLSGGNAPGATSVGRSERLRKALEEQTVKQLNELAKGQGLSGYSKLKKNPLIDKLIAELGNDAAEGILGNIKMQMGNAGKSPIKRSFLDQIARAVLFMAGVDPSQLRAQRQKLPGVNWPATTTPQQRPSIGPSSTGRLLGAAAGPAGLIGGKPGPFGFLPRATAKGSLQDAMRMLPEKQAFAGGPGALALSAEKLKSRVDTILREYFRTIAAQVSEAFDSPAQLKKQLNIFSYLAQSLKEAEQRTKENKVKEAVASLINALEGMAKDATFQAGAARIRTARIFDLGNVQQRMLSPQRVAGMLPAGVGRESQRYATGAIGGESRQAMMSRRTAEAYARSAFRGMDVMGGGAGRPASPYSYAYRGARSREAIVPYASPGAIVPTEAQARGGTAAPAGRTGGRGAGGLSIPNLPGTGLIQELGTEFAFAAKQVLLFGTAYKALAFLTGFPQQVMDAVASLQSFRNTLSAISPTAAEAAASNQFILDTVEKYNIPLVSARDGFTKLYASMKPAGFKTEQINNLYLGISKASATLGLSSDKVDRVTYAFAQMASKGQLMAEEVTGQLGDVIPGALSIMAEAAQMDIKTFKKAMEDGAFTGKAFEAVMSNVPIVLEKRFGKGAEGAAKTFQGAMNNMQTSLVLFYQSFEPVAVGFLNSVVTPMTAGIKTVTDGFNAFFSGQAAQTAQGRAFAKQLSELKPTFDGITANIKSLVPSFQLFGSILLNVAKIFATIAGNPITGFLARVYLNVLALTTAIQILNLRALVPLIASFAQSAYALIAFNVQCVRAGQGAAIANLQFQTLLASLTRIAALSVIAISITVAVNGLMQLKEAQDRIDKLRGEKNPVGPAGPVPTTTASRRYSGATREKVLSDQQKQIDYVAKLRSELKTLEASQTPLLETFNQTAIGNMSDVLGGFVSYNIQAKIEETKLLIKNAEEVLNLNPQQFKTAAEQQRVASLAPIPPGEGKEGAAAAAAAKETARLEAYRSLQDQLSKAASAAEISRIQDEFEERFRLANSYYDLQEARANSFQKITINFQKELLAIEQRRQKAMLDAELDVRKARESVASEAMVSAGEAATGGIVARTGGAVNQNPLTRGRSTGPHLHAQAANVTENTLKYLVDKYLEIGGKAASSFGQSRGAAGHGYNAVDFLTPQDTPIKLKPGASISQYGPAGGRGGLMGQVTTPEGSFQLGHLTSLAASQGTAGAAAPGKILGSERRQTLATQQTSFAVQAQRTGNLVAETKAAEEAAVAIENYVAAIAPMAEQKLQNQVLDKRVKLMQSGVSGDYLETEIKIFETQERQRFGIVTATEEIAKNNQAVKDRKMGKEDANRLNAQQSDSINRLIADVPKYITLIEQQAVAQENLNFQTAKSDLDKQMKMAQALTADAELRVQLADKYPGNTAKQSQEFMQTKQVEKANKLKQDMQSIASAIGDSFGNAFKGIITGSMTAQQALAGFFQSIGDSFADMAAKMISEWLKLEAIKGIQSILSMLNPATALGSVAGSAAPELNIAGMMQYANSPSIPGFATGGIVKGPTLGLVGEGRYNEAVVPLPDGKSIPVDLSGMGGGAGAISTNIVINVSNGQAQSNTSGGASDLGRKMEGAVKQVLVNELRPGGLLGGGRR